MLLGSLGLRPTVTKVQYLVQYSVFIPVTVLYQFLVPGTLVRPMVVTEVTEMTMNVCQSPYIQTGTYTGTG